MALQDLLVLSSVCDLEKLWFQFSIISRTPTHAVPTPVAALRIWCPTLAFLQFKLPMAHLFSPAATWVCSCSWVQWLPLQMLKCLQSKKKINENRYYDLHFPRNGRNGNNEFLQCYFCVSVLARFIISELQSLPSVSSSV